jgi:SWI/SNF-related matrix-associated actin-dependent regulator 1 of chromatin subfamily A
MTSPTTSPEPLPSDDTFVKRRKLAQYDSENDSGDELFAGFIETDTLPLNNATVATQPLPTPTMQQQAFVPASSPLPPKPAQQQTPAQSPSRLPPQIQVPASSPLRGVSSPVARPTQPPIGQPVKPLDFYAAQSNPTPINLDIDGPMYVGSSSDGERSDGGIRPMFGGARVPISTPDSVMAQQRGSVPQQDADIVERIPISMGNLAAKFGYEPVNRGGRLDSLTRSSGYSRGASAAQRRPAPALPARDIDLEQLSNPDHRVKVTRMKTVLPNKTNRELLHALLSANNNYDDAMERLTNDDTVDLTLPSDEISAARGAIKTANRGAGAGKVAIKDKWSSTQAVRRRTQQSSPPSTGPVSRKRKLVKGSDTPRERSESPILIDDDDSEDSAIEQSDSDGERQVEAKVLNYVNICTAKELCDIACTTEEIAEIIIAQRPFATLDGVRQVSAPAAKKSRAKRTKRIGDKVVDVCLETWTGYDAVDSLIRKVEILGKPIAAAIRGWGVDVQTGNESGELEMVELNAESDSQSAKDSGIGTPTDDGDLEIKDNKRNKATGAFKEQPKNMREGVVLKDYQLAGLNWLNLLYEKNLSCILADEMGMAPVLRRIVCIADS